MAIATKSSFLKIQIIKYYRTNFEILRSKSTTYDFSAYASRAMTQSQSNYAQIEKELLAICFGLKKFYQYAYARKIIVLNRSQATYINFQKTFIFNSLSITTNASILAKI